MKILTLSTYPFGTPRHGGQHRLSHIVAAYSAAGHAVRSIGVLGSARYQKEDGFLDYPKVGDLSGYIENLLFMDDWAIGQLLAKDEGYYSALRSLIHEPPDLIHVEHPWLFEFALRYKAERPTGSVKLLYGSANIENVLKRQILETHLGKRQAEHGAQLVLDCELRAARLADLICATSASDVEWIRQHAARQAVLAANGVPNRAVTDMGVVEASRIVGHRKNVLYCASAHPPNISGFFEIFGRGIGCLSPDERLVVAGSAGPNIISDPRSQRVPLLSKRFVAAGEVTEDCLQGLLEVAHAIILPISHGGGTNLKSAEAIWAGKHVVATRVAMRGFEHFSTARGINVCEDPKAFRQTVRAVMSMAPLQLTEEEVQQRRSLLWESTLRPLIELLTK